MRTTIDLPDDLMKKAKMKAVEKGITLKKLFTEMLKQELIKEKPEETPWKKLSGKGSASGITPETTPFDDFSGPDWPHSIQVNEPEKD